LRVLRGRHVEAPDVVYRHAGHARVISGENARSVPVEIDGELFGELDATYDLAPEPARFLVPPEWQP
jgi:diacylglycerol kinase family enzyme